MNIHNGVAAVLLSDLQDHAEADPPGPPCSACIDRAKQIEGFFATFSEMLH